MTHRLPFAALFLGFALVATASAQDAEPTLPADIVDALNDRTPLVGDDAEAIRSAVDHVASLTPESLAEAAERHAEERRRAIAAATGGPADDVSTYRDLLRFPEANRGRAVSLRGIVRRVKMVSLRDGAEAVLVRFAPSDTATGLAVALLPATAERPQEGSRIRVAGLFLKLAEVEADTGPAVVPLLVAPATLPESTAGGLLPDPTLWSAVRHRTLGVRPSERDVYYRLLAQAKAADPAALERVAAEHLSDRRKAMPEYADENAFPVFVDVFKRPQAYEGQAVTLTGYARKIVRYPAGDNPEGLGTLYEAWIYTDDSQGNPAVVVAADASTDLPVGEDLQLPVRATGYFFKNYAYEAQDKPRVAPMILAGRLERLPDVDPKAPVPWPMLALFGLVLLGALALAVSQRRSRSARRRLASTDEPPPDLTRLDDGEPRT